jgi:O-glycosyl hydrolase
MNLTAPEVAAFVAAQGSNCGAPIMAPESFNFNRTYINSYLSNPTARAKTSFVGGHIYGSTPYTSNFGKPTWMTEHYVSSSVSGNDWPTALKAAKEIHDCMNAGWSAYVWWYIRRSYGLIDENGSITKTGYVMANYARYVRPGYTKISCNSNPTPGISVTAYKNSTNKIVIVIVNQNSRTTYQDFTLNGVSKTSFTRYTTNSSSNLALTSFSISGSSFGVNVPASSVVTLVSN